MDQNESLSKSKTTAIKTREVTDNTVQILEGLRPPKNNKKITKLIKAEIGKPLAFEHVQGTSKAIGFDGNNGLYTDILALEGVSKTDIDDKKTQAFIASCINDHDDVLEKKINTIEEPSNTTHILQDETVEIYFGTLKKNKHKKRLSKADIGEPHNFQHLHSISKTSIWNDNNEKDKDGFIHNEKKEFLALAGVSEIDLRNRKTQSCMASISNDHEDVLIVKKNINLIKNSNNRAKVPGIASLEAYFGTLKKSKSNKRLSKTDIGDPHNFQHLYSISKTPVSNGSNELDESGVSDTDPRDKNRWSCIAGFINDHDDTFGVKNMLENFLNNAKVPIEERLVGEVGFGTLKKKPVKEKRTSNKIGEPFNFRHVDGFSKTSVPTNNNEHKYGLTLNVSTDILAMAEVSETDRSSFSGSINDNDEVLEENKKVRYQIQDNRVADIGTLTKSELKISVTEIGDFFKVQGLNGNKVLENNGPKHNEGLALAEVSETDQRDEETGLSIAGFFNESKDMLIVKKNNNAIKNHEVPVEETREVAFSVLKKNPTKVEIGEPYNFRHVDGFSKTQTGKIGKDLDSSIRDEDRDFLNPAVKSCIADHDDVTTVKKGTIANKNHRHNTNVPIHEDTTWKKSDEVFNLKLSKDTIGKPNNFKHVNAACFPPYDVSQPNQDGVPFP